MDGKTTHKNPFLLKVILGVASIVITIISCFLVLYIQTEKLNDTVSYLKYTLTCLILLLIILYLIAYIIYCLYKNKHYKFKNDTKEDIVADDLDIENNDPIDHFYDDKR